MVAQLTGIAAGRWEGAVLAALVRDNAMSEVLDAGISPRWFVDFEERQIFEQLHEHWKLHGRVPSERKFRLMFPDEKLIDLEDPLSSVLADAVLHRKKGVLSVALAEAAQLLQEDAPEEALLAVLDAKERLEEEVADVPGELPTFADVPLMATEWLWEQRVPLGVLTTIAGDGDRGKSTLLLGLAAKVTRGELEGDLFGQPRTVLISSVEDGKRIVTPRLRAAGADMDMVHNLAEDHPLVFPQDTPRLTSAVRRHEPGMVIIDPFLGHFGANDSHKESDVRQALNPLVRIAEDFNTAVVGLQHFNKGNGSATQRLSGSTAWRNVVRSVLICEEAPGSVTEGRYVLAAEKSNLARRRPPSLAYDLDMVDLGPGVRGKRNVEVGVVRFREEVDITAAELLAPAERSSKKDGAADWLKRVLEPGPVPATILREAAAKIGHSERTIDRAKQELGVSSTRHTDHSDWSLPGTDPVCDDAELKPC